jgi:transcriptional regulator with XRE-family HTH domain
MIDPHRTGAFISRLRKEKDWTQLELAEKLHVTHQAVSRWEKGDSFPDLAVLPQIGQLFGVSVDELLQGEPRAGGYGQPARRASAGALVEALAGGQTKEAARLVMEEPDSGIEAALDAVPLAKPSVADSFVSQLAGYEFQNHHLMSLAPFVSQEVLHSLIDSAPVSEVRGELLAGLAPFVGQPYLDRLAQQAGEGALTLDELGAIAPFLSQNALGALVLRADGDEIVQGGTLEMLAPFLDRETLDALVERLPDSPLAAEYISSLAPFLSQPALGRLIDRLAEGEDLSDYLTGLAPFLSQETLRKTLVGHKAALSADDVVELAPFLDKETLTALIRQIR